MPISLTIKQQNKYQTVRVRIALSSFTVASFDRSTVWQYELGGLLVRWFTGRWTLTQRKQRKMLQAIVRDVPFSFATMLLLRRDRPQLTFDYDFTFKSYKIIKDKDGKCSMIGYFDT